MAMDIGNPYADWYYGYEYGQVEAPEPSQGGGGGGEGGVTPAEVQQAIDDALSTINVSQVDDDTVAINVNGSDVGEIDDVYLQNVTVDDEGGEAVVNFHMSNGRDPIQISRSELTDPNIDCSTF